MCTEYKDSEIVANKKFKGNDLEVTGLVDAIDSDFMDNLVVRLSCRGTYSFNSVGCTFSNIDETVTIKKGDKITVYGKSTGGVIDSS